MKREPIHGKAVYYKVVKGRKYAYQCIRSWRDDAGKTHKEERYLGTETPVDRTPIMQRLPKAVQDKIIGMYDRGQVTMRVVQDMVERHTGTKPSVSTVYNFLRTNR